MIATPQPDGIFKIKMFHYRNQIDGLIKGLNGWLSTCKIAKTTQKRESIAQEMFWACYQNRLELTDINLISKTLEETPFKFQEGNLWNYLGSYLADTGLATSQLIPFFQQIADMTPIGLNSSPNACCGKYELLYRLLRPESSQPNRGDILDEGRLIELKGKEVRIQDTSLSGIDYLKNCNQVFQNSGFEGNSTTTAKWKDQLVFEIEKPKNKEHYRMQFAKDPETAKKCLQDYFLANGWNVEDGDLESLFIGPQWQQARLQKLTLKKMWQKYQEEKGFHQMILFGNGSQVIILENEQALDKMEIYSDYFRIGQSGHVGWYIRGY